MLRSARPIPTSRRYILWISRHLPAHGYRFVGGLSYVGHALNQSKHSRVQGLIQRTHEIVIPIYGKGILDQVIGTDAQEIEVINQLVCHDRHRRDFDHHAERNSFIKGNPFCPKLSF